MKNITKDEPAYENCDIIKEFSSPKVECAVIENTPPPLPEKRKIGRPDNIYENVGYIQECLQSFTKSENSLKSENEEINENIKQGENKTEALFCSTFSMVVGDKIETEIPSLIVEPLKLDLREPVTIDNTFTQNVSIDNDDDDDDGSFKSLYAKSLMDSYRQHSNVNSSQTSPTEEVSKVSNLKQFVNENPESPDKENGFKIELNEDFDKHKGSPNLVSREISEPNSIDDLETRIIDLTERMDYKDKEIKKLKHEVLSLKLDCNHSRSEDSSSLLSPSIPNGGLRTPLSSNWSAKSISTPQQQFYDSQSEFDSFTLQQHVASLASQLEKAEFSRHAYESATKQLVNFLQTINSTLTGTQNTFLKTEHSETNNADPNKTLEILTNLENVLLHGRKNNKKFSIRDQVSKMNTSIYDSSRDGSYLANLPNGINESHTKEVGDKSVDVTIEQDRSESDLEESSFNQTKSSSRLNGIESSVHFNHFNSSSMTQSSVHNANRDKTHRRDSHARRDAKNVKKDAQRRRTIPLKFWASSKSELKRSESVSTLPVNGKITPRVNRAASTHYLASPEIRIENTPKCEEYCEVSVSNRLLSSKAKNFFSSLKNIFRHDEDSKGNRLQASQSSSNVQLKLAHPAVSKSKVKSNQNSHSPKSLTSKCNKSNSLRMEKKVDRITHQNSIFYVECNPGDSCPDENNGDELQVDDDCKPVDDDPVCENINEKHINTKDIKKSNSKVSDEDCVTKYTDENIHVSGRDVIYIETYQEANNSPKIESCENRVEKSEDASVDLVEMMSGPQEMSMGLSLGQTLKDESDSNGYVDDDDGLDSFPTDDMSSISDKSSVNVVSHKMLEIHPNLRSTCIVVINCEDNLQ